MGWRNVLFLCVVTAMTFPAAALGPTWFLDRVPIAVMEVPLEPVQLVEAWKGTYHQGAQALFVYAVNTPWFEAPLVPRSGQYLVRLAKVAPWTFIALLPSDWSLETAGQWMEVFLRGYREASALSQPGWPVAYPSLVGD